MLRTVLQPLTLVREKLQRQPWQPKTQTASLQVHPPPRSVSQRSLAALFSLRSAMKLELKLEDSPLLQRLQTRRVTSAVLQGANVYRSTLFGHVFKKNIFTD